MNEKSLFAIFSVIFCVFVGFQQAENPENGSGGRSYSRCNKSEKEIHEFGVWKVRKEGNLENMKI